MKKSRRESAQEPGIQRPVAAACKQGGLGFILN